jgi:hypothetical protein
MDDDIPQTWQPSGGYTNRVFQIESGGNPNAVTGSNRGLGQFGPQEEAKFGINDSNRTDPAAQAAALDRESNYHYPIVKRALGREPTNGEMYLTHQQGVAGGPALLSADANEPAWKVVSPFYRHPEVAQRAIVGNIPRGSPLYGLPADQISAGDFRNFWIDHFEKGRGYTPQYQVAPGGAPSGTPGLAPGSNDLPNQPVAGQQDHGQAALINEASDLIKPPAIKSSPMLRLASTKVAKTKFDPYTSSAILRKFTGA